MQAIRNYRRPTVLRRKGRNKVALRGLLQRREPLVYWLIIDRLTAKRRDPCEVIGKDEATHGTNAIQERSRAIQAAILVSKNNETFAEQSRENRPLKCVSKDEVGVHECSGPLPNGKLKIFQADDLESFVDHHAPMAP
jgi:hypothetical protein